MTLPETVNNEQELVEVIEKAHSKFQEGELQENFMEIMKPVWDSLLQLEEDIQVYETLNRDNISGSQDTIKKVAEDVDKAIKLAVHSHKYQNSLHSSIEDRYDEYMMTHKYVGKINEYLLDQLLPKELDRIYEMDKRVVKAGGSETALHLLEEMDKQTLKECIEVFESRNPKEAAKFRKELKDESNT